MQKTNEKTLINFSSKTWMMHCLGTFMPLLLVCAVLFFFPAKALSTDTLQDEILTAIEKKYTGTEFQADFSQVSKLEALEVTETASGKAWFRHPGKMRWLYLDPERHEIITNGKTLWIYRPDQAQVMRGDAQKFFKAGAGGAFLSDIGLIRKNFTIQLKAATATHATLLLTAKQKNPDMVSILIHVSRTTHEIEQATTRNAYGDTTLFEFSNIKFTPTDASTFEFKIPEGSNIVEMD
ncbi:MAG: outer membrane lipoprotein carrier protein LolA [Desulfobacula sp.]|nr:outer membrane lipoprotein carrier protein LolA [Desulfobacula sp.]